MVYYSRGSTGGWSGQHTFTVDKSGTSGTGYEALRIRDSGDGANSIVAVTHKLGIGTTTPDQLLDVEGSSCFTKIGYTGASMPAGIHSRVVNKNPNSGVPHWLFETVHDPTVDRDNEIFRIHGNETGDNHVFRVTTQGSTASPTYEALAILKDGKVGIGTTSPAFKLEVDGWISTASGIVHTGDTNNTISFGTDTQSFNTAGSARMTIAADGAVAVAGAFSAATKSFDIEHPTEEGKRLHHGSLEGPEHGVYIRGRLEGDTIELPDYWLGLVDEDTITVQLTPNKGFQQIYVDHIEDNKVYVGTQTDTPIDCFYFIQAERKDVEKMVVEY
jgi:hypothetical protein